MLPDELKEKLRNAVAYFPGFDDEDKKSWLKRIDILPHEYLLLLFDIITEAPEDMTALNKNIKEKERIIAARDVNAWQTFLEREGKNLEWD